MKKKIVLLFKIQTLTNGLLGYNDNFLQFITLFNWLIINKVLDTEFSWGLVAQWITRLTTDQKIAGSNPAEIVPFSILPILPCHGKKECAPGWARTTNLSVNSRTR